MWVCSGCQVTSADRIAPTVCAPCGEIDSYRPFQTRSLSDAQLAGVKFRRIATLDRGTDALLLGGFVVASTVLLWGKPGAGKSRIALRWASDMGQTLVLSLEMRPELTRQLAASAGADGAKLHYLHDEREWQAEADALKARVIIHDSITVAKDPDRTLEQLEAWVIATRGVAIVICQSTKKGQYRGPATLAHWPDYEIKLSRANSGRVRVRSVKSRHNPGGIVYSDHV